MKSMEYDAAKNYFELALIEEPTDKDAKALYDMALEKQAAASFVQSVDDYVDIITPLTKEFLNFQVDNNDKSTEINDIIERVDKLENFLLQANKIKKGYIAIDRITEIQTIFIDAVSLAVDTENRYLEILEWINSSDTIDENELKRRTRIMNSLQNNSKDNLFKHVEELKKLKDQSIK